MFAEREIAEWEASLPDDILRFLRARPGNPQMADGIIARLTRVAAEYKDARLAVEATAHAFAVSAEELEALGRPRRIRHLSWLFSVWLQDNEDGYFFAKMIAAISRVNPAVARILTEDVLGFAAVVLAPEVGRSAFSRDAIAKLKAVAEMVRSGLVSRGLEGRNV